MPGHVAIVGYMGSGKTTVGRLLARNTGRAFVDLDAEVSRRAGVSIPGIFAEHGEERFRDIEREALLEALAREENCVVSCGGGAVLRPENRAALRGTPTVFLREDIDVLYARTRGANRPLRGGSREDFARRYAERLPLYQEVADVEVDADGRSAAAVVEEVERCLSRL
ncbi:shikimate kinase [Rubrobacter tropicus]|uniref:Shikimate kinase n=1 Tax=Rubrobacter tropicus TaxID=2653851 RepID=A0A6G8Q975_9ACTN|nr:shikimate kinase [Rubrobacter tropicus]QIN83031.1 shikimate kinase [Rubrobacter tropicus]